VVDQLGQPLGLADDLLQPGPRALGQARLGQRRPCQREYAAQRLPYVVADLPDPLRIAIWRSNDPRQKAPASWPPGGVPRFLPRKADPVVPEIRITGDSGRTALFSPKSIAKIISNQDTVGRVTICVQPL
jgi:hypothetical protein